MGLQLSQYYFPFLKTKSSGIKLSSHSIWFFLVMDLAKHKNYNEEKREIWIVGKIVYFMEDIVEKYMGSFGCVHLF